MQVLLQGGGLALALTLLLVLDSPAQGASVQRARYQQVRCNPNSNSANCIDEKGPLFDLLPGESNRILPPRTDPFSVTGSQNLNDIFPLSEDYSGSGSGLESDSGSGNGFLAGMEHEYQPVDKKDAFYYNFNQDLDQDGPEENFII